MITHVAAADDDDAAAVTPVISRCRPLLVIPG